MKKERIFTLILFVAVLIMGAVYVWQQRTTTEEPVVLQPTPPAVKPPVTVVPPQQPTIIAPPLKKGSRPFYGSLPQGITDIRKLPMANRPVKEWLPRLKVNLQKQGGDRLKELKVIPEESYVISDGGAGRYVERVTVKLTAKDGGYTSFFAEVDSETGYVLKTWGVAIQEKTPHRH
jgi:hypothetical protein